MAAACRLALLTGGVLSLVAGGASAGAQPPAGAGAAPAATPAAAAAAEALRHIPGIRMLSANLQTRALGPMIRFYVEGLGLSEAGRLALPDARQVRLAFPGGGSQIMLIERSTASLPPPAKTFAIFYAPDLEAIRPRLAAIGYARPFVVRQALAGLKAVHVTDPDGNVVEIVQLPPR